MADMQKVTERVGLKLRHGQFDLKYNRKGELEIVGEGAYEGEFLGKVSLKWPYRVKRNKGKQKRVK